MTLKYKIKITPKIVLFHYNQYKAMGGSLSGLSAGYENYAAAHTDRRNAIRSGELTLNRFTHWKTWEDSKHHFTINLNNKNTKPDQGTDEYYGRIGYASAMAIAGGDDPIKPKAQGGGGRNLSDSKQYPGIGIYQNNDKSDINAVTLPGFGIYVGGGLSGIDLTKTIQHEYGHYLDYKYSFYLNYDGNSITNFYLKIGVPSLINSILTHIPGIGVTHCDYWTEIRANQWAKKWFGDNYIKDPLIFPTK